MKFYLSIFTIIYFFLIQNILVPKNSFGEMYSQLHVQYNAYTSLNIANFKYGWGIPNVTLGFDLSLYQIAFFGIRLHVDASYFQFNQTTSSTEAVLVNTNKIFSALENNLVKRKKEILNVQKEVEFILRDKIKQYEAEFYRKLNIQFQLELYPKFESLSKDIVPKGPSTTDIFKGLVSNVFKGFAKGIDAAAPLLSLIPGVGQAAAAIAPIASGSLNMISAAIDSSIEDTIKPETDIYKAGEVLNKMPGLGWIGAIMKATEEEKLRKRLSKVRSLRVYEIDQKVTIYRDEIKQPGGYKRLKDKLNSTYVGKKIEFESRYDFVALSRVIIEYETRDGLKKFAANAAQTQAKGEISILKRRLNEEERSLSKEILDIQHKKAIRIAEEKLRNAQDKYMRFPIAIGPTFYFNFFEFLVPYIETSLLLSFDLSYHTNIHKIRFGLRFGGGIQFEFFDGRLLFGLNMRYWLIHNPFFTIGPKIGFRI